MSKFVIYFAQEQQPMEIEAEKYYYSADTHSVTFYDSSDVTKATFNFGFIIGIVRKD